MRFEERDSLKKNEKFFSKNDKGCLSTNYLMQKTYKNLTLVQNKKYTRLSKLKEPVQKNKHYKNPFRKHY